MNRIIGCEWLSLRHLTTQLTEWPNVNVSAHANGRLLYWQLTGY